MRFITTSKKWVLLILLLLGSAVTCFGQTQTPTPDTPKQTDSAEDWKSKFSTAERDAIARPESPNDRVKTYVRLALQRLNTARDLVTREEFSAASEQIIAYSALVADAGQFTKSSAPKKDKAHKTLETNLREQLRTLESLRRDTSAAQSETFDKAIKIVNQVRRQCLNILLGADGGIFSETDKQE